MKTSKIEILFQTVFGMRIITIKDFPKNEVMLTNGTKAGTAVFRFGESKEKPVRQAGGKRGCVSAITDALGLRCAACNGPIDDPAYMRGDNTDFACCSRECAEHLDRGNFTAGILNNMLVAARLAELPTGVEWDEFGRFVQFRRKP